ncbi:MAG: 6-carboxytetrahydropterin synthase [Pseudomonadales bacterium]|nr:6-carboxytetrahydropterin synthase [Pseudomonadales bacterium]
MGVKMPVSLFRQSAVSVEKLGRIEIAKQALNFSAAHFTIFSATEREDLHGHNWQVECELTSPIDENGLIFDYSLIKKAVKEICDELDEKTILPEQSPHLSIEQDGAYVVGVYGNERIPFLPRDVITLPIANASVEELSYYVLDRVLNHPDIKDQDIRDMTIKVSSSPGQNGSATFTRDS